MSDLAATGEVALWGSLVGGGLAEGGLPGEGAAVGVHVEDAQAGLAPAATAVLDNRIYTIASWLNKMLGRLLISN